MPGGGGGGGGGSRPDCQQRFCFLLLFFLVLNLFYNFTEGVQWLFQGNYNFPRFQRGSNIFQMLISIETHLTCDFPEGSGHLSPPLDPHMTHLCTKMRSTENNVYVSHVLILDISLASCLSLLCLDHGKYLYKDLLQQRIPVVYFVVQF